MISNTAQLLQLKQKLQAYSKLFLTKNNTHLNESMTKLVVNHLLVDVLGYKELDEVKVEYFRDGYFLDYLIQLDQGNSIVIEVKPLTSKLDHKRYLAQAASYAVSFNIKWLILTNAWEISLYSIDRRPDDFACRLVFKISLKRSESEDLIKLSLLTRSAIKAGQLERRHYHPELRDTSPPITLSR